MCVAAVFNYSDLRDLRGFPGKGGWIDGRFGNFRVFVFFGFE